MADGVPLDFVILGPQKCATTWMYRCLREHPEVYLPDTDAVHYFEMNYHRGGDWYGEFFADRDGEPIVGEETASYVRDDAAAARLAEDVPDARLLISVRNPVDRAFSHYWHEKSKGTIDFEFAEVLENYDLFENWVAPGFYHRNLERYLEHFPPEQVKLVYFEDLRADDEAFIRDVFEFVGADPDFTPSLVGERVNESRYTFRFDWMTRLYYGAFDAIQATFPRSVKDRLVPVHEAFQDGRIPAVSGKDEYERGMDEDVRRELEAVFLPDARRLEERTGRDLSHWFEHVGRS